MPLAPSITDLIAGMALILSGYATWKTIKFNERQQSLIESQKRLNDLLLEKSELEAVDARKADIGASFIKLGNSKYRLKIWNKGKAAGRNVQIEFPNGNDILVASEISEKFPLEVLEQHQFVELVAAPHMESKRKHTIRLIWSDDFAEKNEKTLYPTL